MFPRFTFCDRDNMEKLSEHFQNFLRRCMKQKKTMQQSAFSYFSYFFMHIQLSSTYSTEVMIFPMMIIPIKLRKKRNFKQFFPFFPTFSHFVARRAHADVSQCLAELLAQAASGRLVVSVGAANADNNAVGGGLCQQLS